MSVIPIKDGLSEIVERHVPKAYETEICFFPEPGSFIRLRGADQIYAALRQVTYRCGACGQPVSELQMNPHIDGHAKQFSEAVDTARAREKR